MASVVVKSLFLFPRQPLQAAFFSPLLFLSLLLVALLLSRTLFFCQPIAFQGYFAPLLTFHDLRTHPRCWPLFILFLFPFKPAYPPLQLRTDICVLFFRQTAMPPFILSLKHKLGQLWAFLSFPRHTRPGPVLYFHFKLHFRVSLAAASGSQLFFFFPWPGPGRSRSSNLFSLLVLRSFVRDLAPAFEARLQVISCPLSPRTSG